MFDLVEIFSFVGNEERSWKTIHHLHRCMLPLKVILCSSSKSSMFPDAPSSGIERGWIFHVCELWKDSSILPRVFSLVIISPS